VQTFYVKGGLINVLVLSKISFELDVTSFRFHHPLILHLDQGSYSVRSTSATMSAPNSKAFPLANAQLTNQVRTAGVQSARRQLSRVPSLTF
jgi:hypothetical protein